jgi:hypothetical protein
VRVIVKSRTVSTSGSITRRSEREVAVVCHPRLTFLKMSKQSALDLFDTELFITEIQQLQVVWDSRSSSYSNTEEKNLCMKDNAQEIY